MDVHPLLLTWITTPSWHPIPETRLPVYGYLVTHPEGPLLVDTGVGHGNAFIDAQYRPEHQSLDEALGAFGVGVSDIRAVINTHLHFDHCGQNARFPGVPLFAQAAEIEAARGERYTIPAWVDFEGAHYVAADGETTPFPGVRLIPAGSHTPGHQAVAVETDAGLVVIAGQAAETLDEYRTSKECRALRELRPARVYVSHEVPGAG